MLEPDYYYDSVFLIPYEEFLKKNIRGLIFDIDNTLTAFDERLPSPETALLLTRLKDIGFEICLLTNNTNKRLAGFNEGLRLPGFASALKPFSWGVRKAMAQMGTTPYETAIIGDQLLSDIWAGKNAGITTVLVRPVTDKDFLFVKVKRLLERCMLRKYFENLHKRE